ncbi:MAG TPA: NAD(P)/FAD-dependent oxidoreductase [Thermomicrobiales bacterium]|nr:NAD(P)/FAD-dependent oxidoreductase [Thermomicrobiales bacterium]
MADSRSAQQRVDVVIVGAGFAGLYMLHRLRGLGMTARVFEKGDGVGGTWYWNRYPGARCDIESMDYSLSFDDELQQEWQWSERYARQPEILRYVNHVADRFDLRRGITFNTLVTAATWDDEASRWLVETDTGERVSCQFCVMATGCLSVPQAPRFAGLESFRGPWHQTGLWPHAEVDFSEQRVAVIGTGSSAIQSIPVIAGQAARLNVFQRTPNFSVPAHSRPLDPEYERQIKANYAEFRKSARESRAGFVVATNANTDTPTLEATPEQQRQEYEARWAHGGFGLMSSFSDLYTNLDANETTAEFVRAKIRETVRDSAVAELLCPRDYPIGTKRLCVDTEYYETYNQEHVTLVDIRSAPIVEITPGGLRTTEAAYELDAIVFATGFDAMTGALFAIDIRGRGGVALRDKWANGPQTYLGIATAGFPNMFLITGPGSPSVLSNMMVSIEQHVEWVSDCVEYLSERGIATLDPTPEAEERWGEHVYDEGHATLYPLANSWYMGANIPGKPRVFMPYIGGVGAYRKECDEVAAKGYDGFALA